jgi:hypothetical protein
VGERRGEGGLSNSRIQLCMNGWLVGQLIDWFYIHTYIHTCVCVCVCMCMHVSQGILSKSELLVGGWTEDGMKVDRGKGKGRGEGIENADLDFKTKTKDCIIIILSSSLLL